jgi:hypothetical protein
MLSQFSRRRGASLKMALVATIVLSLVLGLVAPAFAATASNVHVRIEGQGGTVCDRYENVTAQTASLSDGTTLATGPSLLGALVIAARLGGFAYRIDPSGYGPSLASIAGQDDVAVDPWPGWMYRVNGAAPAYSIDKVVLKSSDDVLFFYGVWGETTPTVAVVSSTAIASGTTLTVTAKQIDEQGNRSLLSGATVHVGSLTATSAADGTARFRLTTTGDYGVRVEKTGYVRSALTTVRVLKPTAIKSLKVSARDVEVGAVPVVSGVLASGSTKLAARSVRIEHRAANSTKWVAGQTKLTNKAGAVRFSVKPLRTTYYRITFAGNGTYAPVTSARVLVTIR